MIKSEWDLIERIKGRAEPFNTAPGIIYGIGDDCSVLKLSDGRYGLFSADMSVENIHFDFRYTSPHDAGYKSMSSNISDIYAMGGRPVLALVSIGIPAGTETAVIDGIYDGMLGCCAKHGTVLAGGDTSRAGEFVISISIYGETGKPVYRTGAGPGDRIYITGDLGSAMLGLELLMQDKMTPEFAYQASRALRPDTPSYTLVERILSVYSPTSMIDISDGLLSDLGHICRVSGTGFEIFPGNIPVHTALTAYCDDKRINTGQYTLYSGEEYGLVFTSPENMLIEGVTHIGMITGSGYILNNSGNITAVEIKGYDHFNNPR